MMIIRIKAENVIQYANVSQDEAPIHRDAEAAALAGFDRPIAHGMYLMGLAQSLYLAKHHNQWVIRCSMRFIKPVYVDSDVSFHYEVQGDRIKVDVMTDAGIKAAIGDFTVKEGFE